jgi:hypothetical protein
MAKTHRNGPSPLYEGVAVAAEDLEGEEELELEVEVEVVPLVTAGAVPVLVAEPVEEI